MWILSTKLEETFRKVQQIQEHMDMCCLAPDRAKLSIEDLQWAIGDMYAIAIEKIEVAFEGSFVRGMMERYEKRARILIRKDQEEDWIRFACVKELCQVAISEKEDWSVEGASTLEALLYEVYLDRHGDEEETSKPPKKMAAHPIQSEKLAEIAAIELMYPFKYRAVDIDAVAANKITHRALAVHFHAPEFVIGTALSAGHHKIATQMWKKISETK